MKVAIVVNTSWNIYNFRIGLVKALLSEGIEVHAIAPEDDYSAKLQSLGCVYHSVKMDSRGAHPLKDLALMVELYKIYKSIKPDVILQYTIKPNIYGSFAAALLKIPTVNNVCGLGTSFLNKNLVSRIAITLYKLAFKFPVMIFFQNEDDRSFFINKGLVKSSVTDILPGSGINLSHFNPSKKKRNKHFTFLLISRLIHDKGILEYVKAIEILKEKGINAGFQLLGNKDTDHSRGIPESLVNSWIDNNIVEYLGSTEDVRPFIQQADCVVLPSYREGTPRSLLEAASCGKPIVATNVAGCNKVVKHHYNGLLCESKNADDLAEKMMEMSQLSNNNISQMGANSRLLAESTFDEKFVINKYLKTISSL